MKRWLPLAAFVLLAGFLAKGLFLNPSEVPSPLVDRAAPAFSLPLVGEPARSFGPEAMRDRVWLLNVWAPWCVSCRQEHPVLMRLARENRVPIVGLNWKDDAGEAAALLARTGSPYVAVPDDRDGRVGIDYGVTGTPETYLIDRAGVIRLKHVGPITPAVWRERFEPRLKALGL